MKKIINNRSYISSQKNIMKEWAFDKNIGKDPTTFLLDSEETVWWRCSKGHYWEDTIKNRVNGSKCFGCFTKKIIVGFNDLKTLAPHLILEWDYEKNIDITPEEVACCSNRKVWWKCDKGHSWESVISSRYYGSKCPYCMNRKVLTGFNDLQTLNPELAKQWDNEENGNIKPDLVLAGSNQKVGWRCEKGHRWKATVESRHHRNYGCPYCAGKRVITGVNDIKTKNPKLILEWDYIKNGKLKPEEVSYQSHKKIWWKCKYKHSWQADVAARNKGNGCPVCNNKKIIKGVNDLFTINPELALEWAERRNGYLTPYDVSAGSNKIVWWECSEGHEWCASVNDRNRGKGCPTCANRKIIKGFNDLKTINPKLAKEWNFQKNKNLKPTQVSSNSNKSVWWKCSKGHEWIATVNDRSRGNGCPFCYGKNNGMLKKQKRNKNKVYRIK